MCVKYCCEHILLGLYPMTCMRYTVHVYRVVPHVRMYKLDRLYKCTCTTSTGCSLHVYMYNLLRLYMCRCTASTGCTCTFEQPAEIVQTVHVQPQQVVDYSVYIYNLLRLYMCTCTISAGFINTHVVYYLLRLHM